MAVGCGWDPPTREFSHDDDDDDDDDDVLHVTGGVAQVVTD